MKNVTLHLELSDENAWALAQFLKRLGFSDCRSLAVSDDEAWQMLAAGEALCQALAEQGYAPR